MVETSAPDNLTEVIRRLWQERIICCAGILIGILLAVLLMVVQRPHYEASMIVGPTDDNTPFEQFVQNAATPPRGPAMASAYNHANYRKFEQTLRGPKVANVMFQMPDIRSQVAGDSFWRGGSRKVDSAEELNVYLMRHVNIQPVGATPSLRITYRHPDPEMAVKLLTLLRKIDDQLIKSQEKDVTAKRIEWLRTSLKESLNPDHRQALARLLLNEERQMMLLSLDEPFAVQVIEEASSLPHPVAPDPMLYLLVFTVLGFAGGAGVALCRGPRPV